MNKKVFLIISYTNLFLLLLFAPLVTEDISSFKDINRKAQLIINDFDMIDSIDISFFTGDITIETNKEIDDLNYEEKAIYVSRLLLELEEKRNSWDKNVTIKEEEDVYSFNKNTLSKNNSTLINLDVKRHELKNLELSQLDKELIAEKYKKAGLPKGVYYFPEDVLIMILGEPDHIEWKTYEYRKDGFKTLFWFEDEKNTIYSPSKSVEVRKQGEIVVL